MALKKLKSNTGASLLIALLLFLVCVVIGSIVLASATAASGRLSGLAESDRRYYAVTSAAELFRDALMNDNELTVTRSSEQDQTYTWYDTSPRGTAVPGTVRYTFRIDGTPLTNRALSSESILTEATLDYVLGVSRRTNGDAAALAHLPGDGFSWGKSLTVTPSEDAALAVSVRITAQNGALLFTFQNDFTDTPDAMKDQKFILGFTLTPSCSYVASTQSWTVEGETTAEVSALLDDAGEPLLDDAGLPRTSTEFTQTDTDCTDTSVVVTWTASPIQRRGGAA